MSLLDELRARGDRPMGLLLLAHFPIALALAFLHDTWVLAVVVGGLASGGAFHATTRLSGTPTARYVVAAALMAYSALFIQQSHGLVEAHFHIFVSLAFLLVYRDWGVVVFAAGLIAVHHVVAHLLQDYTDLGVRAFATGTGHGLVAVHAAFVVFEVAVLVHLARLFAAETEHQDRLLRSADRHRASLLALAQGLERRDLTVRSESGGDADPAEAAMAQGIGQVAGLLAAIQGTADDVLHSTRVLLSSSEETSRATQEVAGAIEDVARGAERQVRTVEEAKDAAAAVADTLRASAEDARGAAQAAEGARAIVAEGVDAAGEASVAVRSVRDSSLEVTTKIRELAAKSEEIGGIVGTITSIAGQTNLLALNAAIEAARAGEEGRGFAVVAEEVRGLAGDSQAAADRIAGLIGEIRGEIATAVDIVEAGAGRTEVGTATVEQAREAFERIGAAAADVSGRVEAITEASERVAGEAADLQRHMDEVASLAEGSSAASQEVSASTQETSASAQEIAESAEGLSRSAEELGELVGQFRVVA